MNFLYGLLFFYFFFLSADLLHVELFLFRVKITHLAALLLSFVYFTTYRRVTVSKEILLCSGAILLSLIFSAFGSLHPYRTWGNLAIFLLNFVCYFLVPLNLILHLEKERVFRVYFLSFKCIGLFALFQFFLSLFGVDPPLVHQPLGNGLARPNSLSYEPSYYALYMTAFVMFYNAQYLLGMKRMSRLYDLLKICAVNAFLLFSFSTGGFVAYFIFLALALLLSYQKEVRATFAHLRRKVCTLSLLFFASAAVGIFCFPNFFLEQYCKFLSDGFVVHPSFFIRWGGIVSSLNLFLQHPFFGVGLGSVGPYLYQEATGSSIFFSSTTPSLQEIEPYDPTSVVPEILASLGVCGALAFLFLCRTFYAHFKRALSTPTFTEQEKGFACALFLSLLVLLSELQFNQNLFRPYIWVHAALTLGFLTPKRLTI